MIIHFNLSNLSSKIKDIAKIIKKTLSNDKFYGSIMK